MNWYWGCLLLCYALVCQMVCGMGLFPIVPFLPLEGLVHFEMMTNNLKLLLLNDESYASLVNILQFLDSPPDGDVTKLLLDSATATVSNAVNSVDKDSILSILSLPGDKFQEFLQSHPEWTQSASVFTQKFIDAKIKPVIDTQTSSILDSFYAYLNANPDLKLSASEYATKFWNENVLTKSRETIDFLSVSPLAKNTANFLESIQSFQPPTFISSFDTTTVSKLDFFGNGAKIGEKINENFNNVLNSNPKLKLSASEFTKDFIETEIFPRYNSFYSVYRTSPLAQATNRFTSASTSEVAGEVVGVLQEKLKPLTDGVSFVTRRIVEKTFEPFSSFQRSIPSVSTSTSMGTDFSSISAPNFDKLELNLKPFDEVSEKLQRFQFFLAEQSNILQQEILSKIPQVSVDEVLSKSSSSLARANVEFTTQLLAKTQVFSDNTLNFLQSFTFQLRKIATDAVTVLPTRSLQLLEENTKNSVLQVDVLDNTKSQVFARTEAFKTQVLSTLDQAQKWKLFTDENHMQNGYWERTLTDLSSFVDKVANSESERAKIADLVSSKLSLAQENFVRQFETAQSQSPVNQVLKKLQQVDFSKAQQTNAEFQVKVQELQKQLEVTKEGLQVQWEGLQALLKQQQ